MTSSHLFAQLMHQIVADNLNDVCDLLGRGADITKRDVNGFTPLAKAASRGSLSIVRELMKRYSTHDSETFDSLGGVLALANASHKGHANGCSGVVTVPYASSECCCVL